MIKSLDDKSFKADIIDYEKGPDAPYEIKRNSIIEFYLTSCPHCQAMWPTVEAAAEEFPDIDFYKVEVSEHPELAALYNVRGTPTFILIPLKGKPKMSVGEMPLAEFSKLIKESFK
ncbi:MAG: thioredoxin family protein [Bacteroidales bacterium]